MEDSRTIEIEAFFDCSCVWAYLAFEHLRRFRQTNGIGIRWRPVVATDVFDQVNRGVHWPMPEIKQAYYRRDLALWADYLNLPLADELAAPADMVPCMRACVAAGRWDRLEDFAGDAMRAGFAEGSDLGDLNVVARIWDGAGLPSGLLEEGLNWPGIASELTANARELTLRGGFGVPTFFVGGAMFFGNDAVPLVERAVDTLQKVAVMTA